MTKVSKGIFKDGDKFLLLKRSNKVKRFTNLWDFPGGRHDKGETPAQALVREIKEETNLDVEVSEEIKNVNYKDDGWDLLFYYFEPKILQGELKLSDEHLEPKWFTKEELIKLKLHPSVLAFFN
jgi:8-oxo-dGTP diphosphatase